MTIRNITYALQGYPVSKTLAEKEAWKFAEENKIDLITVIPSLIAGPPLTPNVPSSINLAMSLITGKIKAFCTIILAHTWSTMS